MQTDLIIINDYCDRCHVDPSSDDHHTHTAGQVITIAHIGSYETPAIRTSCFISR